MQNYKRHLLTKCIKGWCENISCLQQLWVDLKAKFDYRFLLTYRLTQDCVENLFSVVRSKEGQNVTPNASQFRAAIRSIMIDQMLKPSDDANCDIEWILF